MNSSSQSRFAFSLVCFVIGGLFGLQVHTFFPSHVSVSKSVLNTASGTVVGIGQLPSSEVVSQDVDFKLFWELWSAMKEKYYSQPVSDKALFYGAMSGLAASVGDPYTNYFEPKLAEDFQAALSGKFEGIGAELAMKNDLLTVVAPLPETPAERAGILTGDVIVKIDAIETAGMSVEKAVSLIRGPKGTPVTLTIFRTSQKNQETKEIKIIRDQIQIKSVKLSYAVSGTIAIIDVTSFGEDTRDGFDKAVQEIAKKSVKGVVLDLRNNPGGFLDTSLMVAGEWVGQDVVVKERRQGKIFSELRGTGLGRLKNIPTIVLVNGGSASASEIVAGALQDYQKATILGTKTFGKGSVQDYQNFPDGSGVKITIAEWLTPKERTIHKTGLEPDVHVDRTPEDYEQQRDPQLDRAIGILTGTASSTDTTTSTKTGTSP